MKMTPFFDFDMEEHFKELEAEMEEIEKAIKSGKLKGKWNFKKIEEPGVKGYIAYGRFEADRPLEPFEPVEPFDPHRPLRRPLLPERPFNTPGTEIEEAREPLTDLFDENDAIKIYIELPGEDKENIELNITNAKVKVKAGKFHKVMDLPTKNIDAEKTSARYKNGLLEITIPKSEGNGRESTTKVKIE